MRPLGWFALCVVLGCSGKKSVGGACEATADCDGGQVCVASACVQLCAGDSDCGSGLVCGVADYCVPAQVGQPRILAVDGDGAQLCADGQGTHCVASSIVVQGENLDAAAFALEPAAGGTSSTLVASVASATMVTLALPNLTPGEYVLSASNAAGRSTQVLAFLQGEPGPKGDKGDPGEAFSPTAEQLVGMLNDASAGITNVDVDALIDALNAAEAKLTNVDAWTEGALPPNVIQNSKMIIPDRTTATIPAGYGTSAEVTIQSVHPYTQGFEGPYTATRNTAQDCSATVDPVVARARADVATDSTPCWYGEYDKGPRGWSAGLADGWHSTVNGKILKVTATYGGNVAGEHRYVTFPFDQAARTAAFRFRAWVKVVSGGVSFGSDAGYHGGIAYSPIDEADSAAAPQGWVFVDTIVPTRMMGNVDGLSFTMGLFAAAADAPIEVYLAVPYLTPVGAEAWAPSITDALAKSGSGLVVHPNGRIGVGTDNPRGMLDVNGDIWATNGTIQTSDARLKRDIAVVDDALDRVTKLRGVRYRWKDGRDENVHLGVLAQEVERVLPEAVKRDHQGVYGVGYQDLVPVLIEATKALKAQNDELEARVRALEKQAK